MKFEDLPNGSFFLWNDNKSCLAIKSEHKVICLTPSGIQIGRTQTHAAFLNEPGSSNRSIVTMVGTIDMLYKIAEQLDE